MVYEQRANIVCKCIFIIIYFTAAQDLICALLLNIGIPGILLKLVYYVKELIIIFLGFYCISPYLQRKMIIRKHNVFFALFVLCLVVYMCIGIFNNGFMAAVLGSRQYIIPLIMLVIGSYVGSKNNTNVDMMIRHSLEKMSCFLILSTLIERFLIPVEVWSAINMVNFSAVVKGSYVGFNSSLIQNFYTGGVRRAVGVAAEPLLLAYTLIPLFSLYLAKCFTEKFNIKNTIILIGIFISQVLTLTRAIIISEVVGAGVIVLVALLKNKKLNKKFLFSLILGIILCVGVYWKKISHMIYITLNNMDGGSAGMHMYQLNKGLQYMITYFYGLGTGTGSNLVASRGGENLTTEFAYSNLTVDLGVVGLLSFVLALLSYCYFFLNMVKRSQNEIWNFYYLGMAFCIIIWLVSGVFSPQIWGMKSVLLSWFLFGYAMSHLKLRKELIK